jgi:serine/threonine protein kinase
MLYGTTPFQNSKTWNDLFSRITRGEFSFPSTPPVSEACKAFIRRLLQTDPTKRTSAVEALKDPWLADAVYARGLEEFLSIARSDSSSIVSDAPSSGGLKAPKNDKTAPGDAAFSTIFFESGVRVSFDEGSGSLVIADPKVLMKAAAEKKAEAEAGGETDDGE